MGGITYRLNSFGAGKGGREKAIRGTKPECDSRFIDFVDCYWIAIGIKPFGHVFGKGRVVQDVFVPENNVINAKRRAVRPPHARTHAKEKLRRIAAGLKGQRDIGHCGRPLGCPAQKRFIANVADQKCMVALVALGHLPCAAVNANFVIRGHDHRCCRKTLINRRQRAVLDLGLKHRGFAEISSI